MERTKFQAFVDQKCPRCHEGNMFVGRTYDISKFGKVYHHCEECGLQYEREPGFFTGAMYFSYAINVALIAVLSISLNIFLDLSLYMWIASVLLGVLIAVPFTFRYSRMMMMYLFSEVGYDPSFKKIK